MSSPNLRLLPERDAAPSRSHAQATAPTGDAAADTSLVARSLQGDMAAWGQLYGTHLPGVLRHVCFLTGDANLAEDLAQETFARALAALDRFAHRSSFSTWVHGIAINTVRKHREAAARQVKVRERAARIAAVSPPVDELDRQQVQQARIEALYAILDHMPQHLREAFVLRDLMGVPVAEAAAQLDITEENLRVRAHRGRARVHDALVAAGWIEPEPEEP